MKEVLNFWSMAMILALCVGFASCDNDNEPSGGSSISEVGVIINGVKWSTRNVDNPGTFAPRPESAGRFYQWNRKIAWNVTEPGENEPVSNWNKTLPTGTTWTKDNDPSPVGWRVPTRTEIQSLLNTDKVSREWTVENGVNGIEFIDKTTGNSLFLPSVGSRDIDEGALYTDSYGVYWSSTSYNNTEAYYLEFGDDFEGSVGYCSRQFGQSVRSVAE